MVSLKMWIVIILGTAFLSYSGYLYYYLPVKNYALANSIYHGKTLWQKYNCNSCHQVYGLGGYLGPDLTNVYSSKGPVYIQTVLRKGSQVMPDFKLSDSAINSITDYLHNIDSSGTADPRKFEIHTDGTISK